MKPNFQKTFSALLLGFAIQATFAGNITDINVSVLPDQRRVIKVKFDNDLVKPSGFVSTTPARIALDFPNTKIQLPQKQLSYNDTLLNNIIAADNSERARISLSLGKEGQYDTEVKGNEVWIYVSESNGVPSANGTPAENIQTGNGKNQVAVSSAPFNINFRAGANKTGIISYHAAYDGQPQVKMQGDSIIITLKNYPLAVQDQKNLDVTSFQTPVRGILVRRLGNDTQLTIRTQGNWKHKISQFNGQQEIQITPSTNIAESGYKAKPHKQNFSGKRITLDFQNVDVRTILQILAKESGVNIVASDSVQGKMTLTLKDVPWDQALDLIMDTYDLEKVQTGNIIRIEPSKDVRNRVKEELTQKKEQEELMPLMSQTFQLKYKNVNEFKDILKLTDGSNGGKNGSNSILSERGSALIDPATNTLIITDVQRVIKKFESLIQELDVPTQQVMVEARIVEASEGVSRDLGVKFGYARRGSTGWSNDWKSSINNVNAAHGTVKDTLLNPNVNLPVAAAVNSISLVRAVASSALGLELSALESENRSKTISSPRVLTQDRKEAEIKQGVQIPYQTKGSDGEVTTAFKDAVLDLKVTPQITPTNQIILNIVINKDDVEPTYTNLDGEPSISTKQVKTQAMVENGGTLVVGGVYQEKIANNVRKVPVLGDIPVLGNLFKSRERDHSRNELLFFITPRIMGGESSVMRY